MTLDKLSKHIKAVTGLKVVITFLSENATYCTLDLISPTGVKILRLNLLEEITWHVVSSNLLLHTQKANKLLGLPEEE